ncbi:hypothetical protein [Streptomyces sp. NPDC047972]|uniref:hypothetical protein n=1 Tax=Streptomyces sp. NPDC047972 TaxID=3365493 RepID=UPI003718FD13
MPAVLSVPPGVQLDLLESDTCGECRGALLASDDGSMTGLAGEAIPCGCAVLDGPLCACQMIGWPLNDGFTGWIELTRAELRNAPEDAPVYRPCPQHHTTARAASRSLRAVAA